MGIDELTVASPMGDVSLLSYLYNWLRGWSALGSGVRLWYRSVFCDIRYFIVALGFERDRGAMAWMTGSHITYFCSEDVYSPHNDFAGLEFLGWLLPHLLLVSTKGSKESC